MGGEVELAAKAAGDALAALTEASGALGPPQRFWEAVASGIHYHFLPRTIKQAMAAAEKIRRSGLPEHAYSELDDKLLRAILTNGATEGNGCMQERWANLLANALTDGSARVDRTFPEILNRLEPIEAATLDDLADQANFSQSPEEQEFRPEQLQRAGMDGVGLDNLVGLGLLRYTREMAATSGMISDAGTTVAGASFTNLGWAFVQACRAPSGTEHPAA